MKRLGFNGLNSSFELLTVILHKIALAPKFCLINAPELSHNQKHTQLKFMFAQLEYGPETAFLKGLNIKLKSGGP